MAPGHNCAFTRSSAVLLVVALTALTLVVHSPPRAAADSIDDTFARLFPEEEPLWSDLDVRAYEGPIPSQMGTLLAANTLDKRRWLRGTGAAYRMVYATPDQHGNPALSTAAVFLPKRPPPDTGYRLIAYGHGTVGLGDQCAPSARTYDPDTAAFLSSLLDVGYALLISDYQGLGTPGVHPYLHGMTEANSIVDSIRAVGELDLPLSHEWVMVGHSQGGHAALFTSRFARQIDNDVGSRLLGTVALGPGVNIERLVPMVRPDLPAAPPGLVVYALLIVAGMRETYPDLPIGDFLTPRGQMLVDLARDRCAWPVRDIVEGLQPRDVLARAVAELPAIGELLDEYLAVPAHGYDTPLLIVQGLPDIAVPAPLPLSFAAELAANGQAHELIVHPSADHLAVLRETRAQVVAFIDGLW